ncbi:MAG: alpha-amylase/4-alpha-glucanotransferase domain-containing protein [Terriglobia bacterium]
MATDRVSLSMLIHSHQPVGNFDHVIEDAYQKCYLPFLEVLSRHPRVPLSLHYSGILLKWMEDRHPECITLLQDLTRRGQVEHVGGGYYEPILASIPDAAKVAQLRRQADYLESHFGVRPRGAWITERVWQQGLIVPLARAGVEHTILDDTHFLAAGEDPSALHQVFLTEECGVPLKLVPSLQALRYTIPFRDPGETLALLSEGRKQGRRLFAVGDDCEKFGVWPGTYEHCYTNGWLERFFRALEDASEWLDVTTISDFISAHPPERRTYLPTASYSEMMTWALPTSAAEEMEACLAETASMPNGARLRRFMRGGSWLNFLSKYPESNQFQKLMLRTFRRWEELRRLVANGTPEATRLACAEDHLLAAQCNDAYWHGIFGGLYAPHLRNALEEHLIRAETVLDQLENEPRGVRITTEDFDIDGHDEVLVDDPCFGIIIRPADGGSVSSLRAKTAGIELINSLQRRPEPYHAQVRRQHGEGRHASNAPASIHDQMRSKEANLASLLHYDQYARHCFRTYLFPRYKSFQDFDESRLEENAEMARGCWRLVESSEELNLVRLRKTTGVRSNSAEFSVCAEKWFSTRSRSAEWSVDCQLELSADNPLAQPWSVGLEMVLNLLAPNAPDRYYSCGEERHPLEFRGALESSRLALVDEWQRLEIALESGSVAAWWVTPIQTISQSESGFERIYQGSSILAVWNAELGAGNPAACHLRMKVRSLAPAELES